LKSVVIHTDGACKGNPGPGGWGALLEYNGSRKEIFGGEAQTTNNRMELVAVIRALEALTRESEVDLYTDSQYVKNGHRIMDSRLEAQWLENQRQEGRQERRPMA
jgi:ribonuclease HI